MSYEDNDRGAWWLAAEGGKEAHQNDREPEYDRSDYCEDEDELVDDLKEEDEDEEEIIEDEEDQKAIE
jgi:hypothetical protein